MFSFVQAAKLESGVVVKVVAFNPSSQDLCEFKDSLVYKVSSKTVVAVTQRNPI